MRIYYNPVLKEYAKKLRKNSTLSEVLFWKVLQSEQFKKFSFNRQKPIGEYIVDFFCLGLMLVIEIDGFTHHYKIEKDAKRDEYLKSVGISVLRFSDSQVKNNMYGAMLAIQEYIDSKSPLSRGVARSDGVCKAV